MSSVGSFGTFTTARLAIFVAQKGLSVTGNNIANINTVGYTRQRLDQVSFKTGGSDRYQNSYDMHVGNGAVAKTVSQLRDPYLDIRYRAEHSAEGFYDGWLDGLDQIATILDEIGAGKNKNGEEGDGLIHAQLSDFLSSLQHVQTSSGTEVNDTLAFNSADALCQLFQSGAARLERLRLNTETQLRQGINDINDILISIRKLNESIQQADIYGDKALELRDERNNFIDKLSEKLKISATYSMVDIGGRQVEKLTIRLGDANPDKDVTSDSSILVDGNYCTQLTTPKANEEYDPQYEIFDRKSAAYEQAVKDFKSGKQVINPVTKEVFANQDELEGKIDRIAARPDLALKPYAYLDENGEGTNDPRDAAQEFNEYYDITLSELRDRNDREWEDYPDVRDTYVKDPLLSQLPQKAKYTASFQITGGDWKDGDKITVAVNDTNYTVEVGTAPTPPAANTVYLSAASANADAKNISNAIRQALLKDEDLAAEYDISTKTTRMAGGFNVDLTLKAKVPEKKTTEPVIDISSPATGNKVEAGDIIFSTMTPVAESNPAKYTTEVSVTAKEGDKAFHKGDTIEIGGKTYEVGKDISPNKANDPKQLASFLARELSDNNFTVTAKDGVLTFTAKSDTAGNPTVPTITTEAAPPAEIKHYTHTAAGWDEGKVGTAPDPATKIEDNGDNTTSKYITSYVLDDNDKWHEVVKTIVTSKDKVLDDNDLYGELQAVRELLTEEGEFASAEDIDRDESAAIKRGIPFYQHTLDLLARQFAETMNEANNGYAVDEKGNYLAKDGTKIELARETLNKYSLTDAQKTALINAGFVQKDKAGNPVLDKAGNKIADPTDWLKNMENPDRGDKAIDKMGGNLFSIRGDTDDATGITAANITVAQSWSNGLVHVVPSYIKLFGGEENGGVSNTTQNDNALHMGHLMEKALVYNPQNLIEDAVSEHLFAGSFAEMFVKMDNTLGNDQRATNVSLMTHMGQALDIDTSRDSVSAVDLNDEAMDLMQYTHSLNAAYRLMTTLDEMLERLITGTGVTR